MDTKIPAIKKQKSETPKPGKGMLDGPIEIDPYKRLAVSVVKDLPTKKDLIEKFESFITAAEAAL